MKPDFWLAEDLGEDSFTSLAEVTEVVKKLRKTLLRVSHGGLGSVVVPIFKRGRPEGVLQIQVVEMRFL